MRFAPCMVLAKALIATPHPGCIIVPTFLARKRGCSHNAYAALMDFYKQFLRIPANFHSIFRIGLEFIRILSIELFLIRMPQHDCAAFTFKP